MRYRADRNIDPPRAEGTEMDGWDVGVGGGGSRRRRGRRAYNIHPSRVLYAQDDEASLRLTSEEKVFIPSECSSPTRPVLCRDVDLLANTERKRRPPPTRDPPCARPAHVTRVHRGVTRPHLQTWPICQVLQTDSFI